MYTLDNMSMTLNDRLRTLHARVKGTLPEINRIAVGLYSAANRTVGTFAHSSDGSHPLDHYEVNISAAPSLAAIAETRAPRIVDDYRRLEGASSHTRTIIGNGHISSVTFPLWDGLHLRGFLFINASEPGYFRDSAVMGAIEGIRETVCLMITAALSSSEGIRMAALAALEVSHVRDEEGAGHLLRTARYSQLIARRLAQAEGLSDEWVQLVHMFAPLHDVGKVGIPDCVLRKPGPLDGEEFAVMKMHTVQGADIVHRILAAADTALYRAQGQLLYNIVRHHHENWNGTGYPDALSARTIPLEARVVAVADVFDALISRRPYKKAWSVAAARALMESEAGQKFDPACVQAFLEEWPQVLDTARQHSEGIGPVDLPEAEVSLAL